MKDEEEDENENQTILFFKKKDKFYFLLNKKVYEYNYINISILKEMIKTPYRIIFNGIDTLRITLIINALIDNNTHYKITKIDESEKYMLLFYDINKENANDFKILKKERI